VLVVVGGAGTYNLVTEAAKSPAIIRVRFPISCCNI